MNSCTYASSGQYVQPDVRACRARSARSELEVTIVDKDGAQVEVAQPREAPVALEIETRDRVRAAVVEEVNPPPSQSCEQRLIAQIHDGIERTAAEGPPLDAVELGPAGARGQGAST